MTTKDNDTICAIASAPGGAIGIVRVSGPDAIAITGNTICRSIKEAKGNTIVHAYINDKKGDAIDEVLVSVFRAPHSYTGEDSTEISCHGSPYIMERIVERLVEEGCRNALPGEYTQRAFLNGKMDLSQAEAVADLIASTNAATHRMAMSQLRGLFSSRLARLREQLLKITSLVELELDFSDQDVTFADREELLRLTQETRQHIEALERSFATGNALKRGIAVAIAGKTNVGKSTLLNLLVGDDRSIVSDQHGTTRDTIEETMEIKGVTFRFIDTAGLRHTDDAIELMGIDRTKKAIDRAAIVVWIVDEEPTAEECCQIELIGKSKPLIVVENKTDIDGAHSESWNDRAKALHPLPISAKYDMNTDLLRDAIYDAAGIPEIGANDVIVTSARHHEALTKAQKSIDDAINAINAGLSGELLSEHLRECIGYLSDIVGGAITPEETLNNIFSHFCIGK